METIILFSRCNLVHLYGKIGPHLEKKINVIHIAYSDYEQKILEVQYNVKDILNFKKGVSTFISKALDYKLINEIDKVIIKESKDRFSLNSAIQSDRTFDYLSYEDSLILTQAYYCYWKNIFETRSVNYILHEPTSLYFNHIASLLGKQYGVRYLSQISTYGLYPNNYIIVSGDDSYAEELQINLKEDNLNFDSLSIEKFLQSFREDETAFFSQIEPKNKKLINVISISFRILFSSIKNKILALKERNKLLNHVEYYINKSNTGIDLLKKTWETFLFIKYDKVNSNDKYFYYPLHLEPEAVVLYWGDGIYKNQVKLIENIAAQLPPFSYLYIKDHPHAGYYRDYIDYKRIKAIPNVKLINPLVSGKFLIKTCIGVITISGTSGFEALLLNKQVYTFGNCFYNISNQVIRINNIRELREIIYKNINRTFKKEDLITFLAAYLRSCHEGFVNYFLNYVDLFGIDEEKNAEFIAQGLMNYFEKCNSTVNTF